MLSTDVPAARALRSRLLSSDRHFVVIESRVAPVTSLLTHR